MSDRLNEIEERWAEATPGQWKMLDGWGPSHLDGRYRAARIGTADAPVFSPSGPYGAHDIIARKEDFECVAYAAGDIAWLIGEVKRLRVITGEADCERTPDGACVNPDPCMHSLERAAGAAMTTDSVGGPAPQESAQ